MKIKVTFSKIVDADSIDEAYDKVTKDIASSIEQQGDSSTYLLMKGKRITVTYAGALT